MISVDAITYKCVFLLFFLSSNWSCIAHRILSTNRYIYHHLIWKDLTLCSWRIDTLLLGDGSTGPSIIKHASFYTTQATPNHSSQLLDIIALAKPTSSEASAYICMPYIYIIILCSTRLYKSYSLLIINNWCPTTYALKLVWYFERYMCINCTSVHKINT